MKYRHKLFLATLLLFLAALNIGAYLLAQASYDTALQAERERALGEYAFLANAMERDIISLQEQGRLNDGVLRQLYQSYAEYYYLQGLLLGLELPDGSMHANLPGAVTAPEEGSRVSVVRTLQDIPYLFVSGRLSEGFVLTSARSIASTQQRAKALAGTLAIGSVALSVALSIALMLILHRMTQPLQALEAVASQIARGDYQVRARVKGKDEVAALAQSFHTMAEAVGQSIESLEQTAWQRQVFIDNLAHEMRTPLTAINGYAAYLMEAPVTEDDRLSALTYIRHESRRISEISEKLLMLTSLRQDEIVMEPIVMHRVLEDVRAAIAPQAAEKQVEVAVSAGQIYWEGDETLYYMLLLNLAVNALRACAPGGHIRMEAAERCISVRDDGCGILEEALVHITEPFYRADKARDRAAGGAGLGLALCSTIADRLGLRLSFESAPGCGTAVHLLQVHNHSVEAL